jgi:hypothetical protein
MPPYPCPGLVFVDHLFNKRDPKLVQQKPCKGAETDSRAKFGKETIAGAYRRPK